MKLIGLWICIPGGPPPDMLSVLDLVLGGDEWLIGGSWWDPERLSPCGGGGTEDLERIGPEGNHGAGGCPPLEALRDKSDPEVGDLEYPGRCPPSPRRPGSGNADPGRWYGASADWASRREGYPCGGRGWESIGVAEPARSGAYVGSGA